MATNVFAKFRILAEIVTINWIHASRIVAIMAPSARPAQTIKIFRAVVHLGIRDACAIKISMNVRCHHHAAMGPPAKIYPAHINVCVQKATKVEIVQ